MNIDYGHGLINAITQFFEDKARPTFEESDKGTLLYSPSEGQYKPLIERKRYYVSTIEAFIDLAKEEARRTENATGHLMTASFTLDGGQLRLDDPKLEVTHSYERKPSHGFEALKGFIDSGRRGVTHKEFIKLLQGLKPWIFNSSEILNAYRKVTFEGKNRVISQPIVENGLAGKEIGFTLEVGQGAIEMTLPQSFLIGVPFAMGSANSIEVECLIDMALEGSDPRFYVHAPSLQHEVEQAILKEKQQFTYNTEELPKLLKLASF